MYNASGTCFLVGNLYLVESIIYINLKQHLFATSPFSSLCAHIVRY